MLKNRAEELQLNAVSVSGAEDVKTALMMAKLNKSKSRFIEGMMCSGGCTGGAGTLATMRKSKSGLAKYTGSSKIKSHKDNELLEAFKNIKMSRG